MNSATYTSPEPIIAPSTAKPAEKKAHLGPGAYVFFQRDKRAELTAQNPSANFIELSKLSGKLWGTLTDAQKQVCEDYNLRHV